jgi:hypothetical protein
MSVKIESSIIHYLEDNGLAILIERDLDLRREFPVAEEKETKEENNQ